MGQRGQALGALTGAEQGGLGRGTVGAEGRLARAISPAAPKDTCSDPCGGTDRAEWAFGPLVPRKPPLRHLCRPELRARASPESSLVLLKQLGGPVPMTPVQRGAAQRTQQEVRSSAS